MRWIVSMALALALALGSAASASAQEEPPEFQGLVDRGMQHYAAREYEQAIELFQQAFAMRGEPELVYNIARSYERLARRDDAIREYERFVALPGTTAELRTRALGSIAALREEARLEAASRAAATPPPSATASASTAPPSETRAEPQQGGSSGVGTAGWVLTGIGGAAVVAGVITGVIAFDRNAAFEDATLRSEQIALRDEVRTYALVTDVLLIGGGVIAATGIVLAIVGASESSGSERADATRVIPLVSPEVAGVGVSGRF
ncbi:tetratricopeptide repeat protein [Sandaracinus amylolyticus]|uniref:Tetratricopeptide repeat protein n=1 Tax=Sandaracinus amylolyticus TaxID=927083 RepID=A0A0F6VYU4_9BACT|nr:tetratricopeptide repeat protein [Sandaracinus amylolyticus]AKF02921.1 hypothetical protein DB32_000069 [Sandaracinus amylolyticus]